MNVIITYDELVSNQYEIHTNNTIKNKFYTKIIFYFNKYNVKDVITNAKIAISFEDCPIYKHNNTIETKTFRYTNESYLIGYLNNINIWVNPQMQWSDNKIIIKDNLLIIRKNKILKLIKGKEFVDVLEKILIDNKLADFLI
jgi:hypothetical protein